MMQPLHWNIGIFWQQFQLKRRSDFFSQQNLLDEFCIGWNTRGLSLLIRIDISIWLYSHSICWDFPIIIHRRDGDELNIL